MADARLPDDAPLAPLPGVSEPCMPVPDVGNPVRFRPMLVAPDAGPLAMTPPPDDGLAAAPVTATCSACVPTAPPAADGDELVARPERLLRDAAPSCGVAPVDCWRPIASDANAVTAACALPARLGAVSNRPDDVGTAAPDARVDAVVADDSFNVAAFADSAATTSTDRAFDCAAATLRADAVRLLSSEVVSVARKAWTSLEADRVGLSVASCMSRLVCGESTRDCSRSGRSIADWRSASNC